MFIAKNEDFQRILRASQVTAQTAAQSDLLCPVCGGEVAYNTASEHPFDAFCHVDGASDCFRSEKASDGHRLAVEVAVETIYNRLTEVTGESANIDVERQIGSRHNFVIADVRVSSPLQIAAEIFHRVGDLGLQRRLDTLSANDYRAFLIFHSEGTHDPDRINMYFEKISPLNPGYFNATSRNLVLGDLFSQEHLDWSSTAEVPRYIYSG